MDLIQDLLCVSLFQDIFSFILTEIYCMDIQLQYDVMI